MTAAQMWQRLSGWAADKQRQRRLKRARAAVLAVLPYVSSPAVAKALAAFQGAMAAARDAEASK